jgi:hypothetical protein
MNHLKLTHHIVAFGVFLLVSKNESVWWKWVVGQWRMALGDHHY